MNRSVTGGPVTGGRVHVVGAGLAGRLLHASKEG